MKAFLFDIYKIIIDILHELWRLTLVLFNAITRIFQPIDFAIINIAVVLIIFGMSQFSDVFAQFNLDEYLTQEKHGIFASVRLKTILLVFLWSFFLYYSVKLALFKALIYHPNDLSIKYFQDHEKEIIRKICKYFITEKSLLFLPAIVSLIPPLIIAYNLFSNRVYDQTSNNAILITITSIVLFLSRYITKTSFYKLNPIPDIELDSDKPLSIKQIYRRILDYQYFEDANISFEQKKSSKKVIGKSIVIFIGLTTIFFLGIYIYFLLFNINILINKFKIDSITVVLLSALFWGAINFVISFFNQRFKFSFYILLMIWIGFASFFNNNHEIRTSAFNKEMQDSLVRIRPYVHTYIEAWVDELIKKDSTKIHDVFIIAGEGGGLRATFWTAGVLQEFQKSIPNFRTNTLAISGVSGGSVGIYLNEKILKYDSLSPKNSKKLKKICEADYLSPVTLGLTFRDAIQRFIPISIRGFDRARFLEESFENQSNIVLGLKDTQEIESTGFLNDFGLDIDKPTKPILLFNTTEVELGRKAIFSNAELGQYNLAETDPFFDVIDVFKITRRDIPLVSAATASARFPVLTPPALITYPTKLGNHVSGFHIVDGGYYENTGLHTAYQILKVLNTLTPERKKKIRPVIVFLKNGNPPNISGKTDNSKVLPNNAIGFPYEFSPIFAFVGAWDRKTHTIENDFSINIKLIYEAPSADHLANFNPIILSRDQENLPLGWDLSTIAVENIDKQLHENAEITEFIRYYKK